MVFIAKAIDYAFAGTQMTTMKNSFNSHNSPLFILRSRGCIAFYPAGVRLFFGRGFIAFHPCLIPPFLRICNAEAVSISICNAGMT